MKISNIIKSWDIWLALLVTITVAVLLPGQIKSNFAKEAYFVGLSVLAIIFSIFFASLAIIMSSSHDDFVSFLEEKKQYTAIIATFRYTLVLLFIALLISIIFYIYTSYLVSQGNQYQSKWWFVCFSFVALYALLAVVMSTGDTISYSKYRARFVEIKRKRDQQNQN
jgi:uncharacterized protein YacL